jgi:hypothetical protein
LLHQDWEPSTPITVTVRVIGIDDLWSGSEYFHVFALYILNSATFGCTISISEIIACGVIFISILYSPHLYSAFHFIKLVQKKFLKKIYGVFAFAGVLNNC